jgi:hypothetical protein
LKNRKGKGGREGDPKTKGNKGIREEGNEGRKQGGKS